ncbi:sporulation protein [Aeribacillus pallidus]|uniref:GerMN domain-containing protein n=1 Tax=Aeribacillus TaxID=1055323 RepID=UPI001022BC23|nr:GerMN domain-containing protein [Aeribacillus pallidus]RZI53233.1 sporulation protein [Aeribacillus pallidus]
MPKNRWVNVTAAVLATFVLLSGCSSFGSKSSKQEIDPPQDITYLEDGDQLDQQLDSAKSASDKEESSKETVKRVLYLIDKNGMVVPQTLELPNTKEVAKQAVEYLVAGGPVSNILPNGFRAVLPEDTVVKGVDIKDGTAIVDFSNEFTNYKPEDEEKILQAITWTLTQFKNINKVKLWVNGHELKEMPVNGTPIGEGTTRKDGINIDTSDAVDITDTHPLTVYYIGEEGDNVYYVPVTKRISNEEKDEVVAAVNALVEGPDRSSGLLSEFQSEVKLIEKPKYEDGQVTLNFNEAIYGSYDEEKKIVSNHVINSLVLTLTEQEGIEKVALKVNGKQDLVNEDGKSLSEPVSRPENVNTGSF